MGKRVTLRNIATILVLLSLPLSIVAEKATIYLEHSNTLSFDQDRLPDCQILKGDVQFRHDNAVMYCDSAHFYSKTNILNAFSNVKMVQGDSIYVYGDKLLYDGNTKLARLRSNIRVENKKATLFTDSLNYDRQADLCYYFDHGTIVDKSNTLKSVNGKFSPKTNIAVFQKSVILTNKDMELRSDTLKYNTDTHIATIVGPSYIYFDDAWIYSTKGWYDTDKENCELLDRSVIKDYEGHDITGDTIKYNRAKREAEALTNIAIGDSVDNLLLKGGYGYYNELLDSAYIVNKATVISFEPGEPDSIYVTADTLFYSKRDSVTNIKGYYNVQAWSKDFQGIADSIFYSTSDSIGRMFGTPVAWQGRNQSTGDSIVIYTKNGEIDRLESIGNAFMFMKNDTTAYNQMSGKTITCYMDSGRAKKLFVEGNALSVYFPEEETEPNTASADSAEYVGVNVSESSAMTIYIGKDNKPERIVLTPASKGTLYTPKKVSDATITKLKGLLDCYRLRPISKTDIYNAKDKSKLKQASEAKIRHKRKKR